MIYHNKSQVKVTHYLRPLQRLFTGKLRLVALLTVFAFTVIYLVKSLQTSNTSNVEVMLNVYEYAENVQIMKDKLHYAIVIDAGSSGSRVHIYTWPPHSGDTRQLLNIKMLKDSYGKDIYEKITPGLSSCGEKPNTAFEYISPLLKFAEKHIPADKHRQTPLFILATAGMRLLPLTQQEAILKNLRDEIPRNYTFMFSPNYVEVITGKEEGIYSWIAVNYLLDRFDHTTKSQSLVAINLGNKITTRPRTVGMLEMGGASMQIAFEIISKYDLQELKERQPVTKNVLSEFNLGCLSHDEDHNYLVYVTTYLGLGANVAQEAYARSLLADHIALTSSLGSPTTVLSTQNPITLSDPCMVLHSIRNSSIKADSGRVYSVVFKGTGDWEYCEQKLEKLINPERESSLNCKVNVSCPLTKLRETVVPFASNAEFYGFSELWYSMEDVLRLGGQYNYDKLKKAASEYCKTEWTVLQDRYQKHLYPLADEDRLQTECFKSAWIATVLHKGFKMPKTYNHYKSSLNINHNQVQWTLGALLYRTRFFPLRAIEKNNINNEQHSITVSMNYLNQILFLLCMSAVVACIVIYLRHLHQMINQSVDFTKSSTNYDLLSVQVDKMPLIDAREM
ncbi:ectonucleoside triphosphate diphosphohydrolase 7-like protein [Leptotrombidium deliense]|uniref:Ectonucleoside triphosphate diphosphohydrolase 7-like protein n=1 Tax=Leptotrombidium deliense TaxID=299467 RepID=A0A443SHV3_9ACAR|nr:ectonucleoside triphosphate diphosphohydrolase 7-like protein [Leptotrombidium deliense]